MIAKQFLVGGQWRTSTTTLAGFSWDSLYLWQLSRLENDKT